MDAKEDIKQRLSIEDVISEYVQLKRAGKNFKGLSPFTSEKTPSFIVSPEKQIWHDFSSSKGGDVFSFVMEMEGLDFKGALELLARKAGIDLSQYQTGRGAETGKLKERLYEANEAAARFYQVQFSKSKSALGYVLKQRKFSKDIALEFRLGYSPNGGTALLDFLKNKGFSEDEIQKAGLISKRYRSASDMFRGRLMIPLQDQGGRVIGFTARLLEDGPLAEKTDAPKYINTPSTLLYDKSRHVYGLHLAKEAIRQSKYAVLVEGNLDVIASHQAGVRQVVATAGTALTEMHLKTLARFAEDVRLAFDQDKAGLAATERAIPIAGKVGVNLSIITVTDGKDPDELIKKDPKLWQKAIESHEYALDWLIGRYKAQLDLGSARGKREFSDVILRVIRQLPDSVEQDHYIGVIAEAIGASKAALEQKLHKNVASDSRKLKRTANSPPALDPNHIERTKAQNQLLALTLMQPPLRYYLESLTAEMLSDDPARKLLTFLQKNPQEVIDPQTLHSDAEGSHEDAAQGSDGKQAVHSSALLGANEARTEPYHEYGEGVLELATTQSAENTGVPVKPVSRGMDTGGVSSSARKQSSVVQSLQDYVKVLGLHYEELYQGLELLELRNEAARLQARLIEQYVKTKKHELAAAMRVADGQDMGPLLEQAKLLDTLLKKI